MKYVCILLSVLALTACGKKTTGKTSEGPMTVSVGQAYTDSITIRKSFPGRLQAVRSADVVGRVNGTLLAKHYKPGTYVRAGQPLFTIESTTYRNAAKQAAAQLESARSRYSYAQRNYQALQKAHEADAVSAMEVLQAKSAMEQGAADISQAQAALNDANTSIGYCTVRAPFSGYVSDATLEPGAYVGGAAQPVTLATIYDNSAMEVIFNIADGTYISMFSSPEAERSRPDYSSMPITFAEPLGHDYTASLSYQAPAIDPNTGTLVIKATIPNPHNELRAGMQASISMPFATLGDAVLVKDAAISTDQRGKYLYTVNDSNRIVYTPVRVGATYQDTLRVIEEGIRPGQRYVTEALLKVRPGMKVIPRLTR